MPLLVDIPDAGRARRARVRVLLAVPLALMMHALVAALIVASATRHPPKSARAASKAVSLRPISSTRWATNRGMAGKSTPERPAPLHPKGQVVDVAPGNNRVPVESKYLAESNNQVQRETRAREQTSTWSHATPKTQPNPTAAPSAKGRPAPSSEIASAPGLLSSILGRRPLPLLAESTAPGSTDPRPPSTEEPSPVGTAQGTASSGAEASEGGGAPNDDSSRTCPPVTAPFSTPASGSTRAFSTV